MAKFKEPYLSVTGVTETQAKRAIAWMKNRSLLAFYDADEKSLCAFEFKYGREWTYEAMYRALEETRR